MCGETCWRNTRILRKRSAHDYVKNRGSNFPPRGPHCGTILQHQVRQKSDRARWHQQDHDVEEVRLLYGTSHMRKRSLYGVPVPGEMGLFLSMITKRRR